MDDGNRWGLGYRCKIEKPLYPKHILMYNLCNMKELGKGIQGVEEMMTYMKQNVEMIREKMSRAAERSGRKPEDVLLLAACKTRTIEEVAESACLPIDLFGENHVQELVDKKDADAYKGKPAHLIGHLQTNKIKYVLGRADLIQSVDSERLLTALEVAAAKRDMVQEVLIEVNIGEEESKTGLKTEELWRILELSAGQPHIRVRGLMTIPPADTTDCVNRKYFEKTRLLYEKAKGLQYDNVRMEILSMGMSQDFENAIMEGSTMIRVGSLIYGQRKTL